MTIEQYVESILKNHPEINQLMDKILEEHADDIKATCEMYERTKDLWHLPRYMYVNKCEDDEFEIQVDLYNAECTLIPV